MQLSHVVSRWRVWKCTERTFVTNILTVNPTGKFLITLPLKQFGWIRHATPQSSGIMLHMGVDKMCSARLWLSRTLQICTRFLCLLVGFFAWFWVFAESKKTKRTAGTIYIHTLGTKFSISVQVVSLICTIFGNSSLVFSVFRQFSSTSLQHYVQSGAVLTGQFCNLTRRIKTLRIQYVDVC